MSRKRSDRTIKRQDNKPVKTQTGLIEEQVEDLNYRALTIISTVGFACALLFLIFFFSSGIPGKIIAAKAAPVYAAQTSEPYIPEVLDVLDSTDLNHMSDDDFELLIKMVTEKVEAGDTKVSGAASALIHATIAANRPDSEPQTQASSDKEEAELQVTLDDAYAEAERLYPGQIDGSKRLKLVEALNATSYMYYVAEEGDTLIKLSRAFNVSLGQLVELNGIHDADLIPAGMILLFPSDTEQPDIRE